MPIWLTPFAKVYSIKAIKTLAKFFTPYPHISHLPLPLAAWGSPLTNYLPLHLQLVPLRGVRGLSPIAPTTPTPSHALPHRSHALPHRSHHLPSPPTAPTAPTAPTTPTTPTAPTIPTAPTAPIIARAARTSHRSHLPFPSCPPSGVRRLVSNC